MVAYSIAFAAPDNHAHDAPGTAKPFDVNRLAESAGGDKERESEIISSFLRDARTVLHKAVTGPKADIVSAAIRLELAADDIGASQVALAAKAAALAGDDNATLARLTAAILEAENFALKLCR